MTVSTSQAATAARRVMSVFLWVALVVIVAIAAANSWAAYHSGNHTLATAAGLAGLAPILLAVLVTRKN